MSSLLTVRPLSPILGAELIGLKPDLSSKSDMLAEIEAALVKHEVIILHVPDLSLEDHQAIGQHFGMPEIHTYFPNLGPEFPQITIIDSKRGERADMWHHDESFLSSPPIVTMTQAKITPPCGGDTCWISMTSAYDALSDRMKHYLEGLQAWHDMNAPIAEALRQNMVTYERYVAIVQKGQRHLHDMVKIHPQTGRKALFISPTYTTHIEGISTTESNALLGYLHTHCQNIKFMFRHRWHLGDMAIWDNRSVLHNAVLDYQPHQRRMHRISVFARKQQYISLLK